MNTLPALPSLHLVTLATALAAGAGAPTSATAQISLTADIFPFEVGHERAYATHASPTIDVAGLIGPEGGPQTWDFTDGPTDNTYHYRNLAPADSPSPGSFPAAMISEKLTITSTGQSGYSYFAKNTQGRDLLGFHDGIANPDFPLVVFRSPLREFPRTIEFGSQWSESTTFPTQQLLLGSVFDLDVTLHIDSKVDAFGTLRLPGIGKIDVLRVNELDRQQTLLDTGNELIVLSEIYVRVIYWISRDYGIVAQISSQASEQLPDTNSLVTAARFLRQSAFSNPVPFQATIAPLGQETVRLSWNALPGVASYTIETTTSLRAGEWNTWMTVEATSIDTSIDSPYRAFRVTPASPQ